MTEKIGILGLGLIGRTVAEMLIPKGYRCYAVRRPSTRDFPGMGGQIVNTAREMAETVDILISALPSVDAAREAFNGDDGVVTGARHGLTVVDMNTFSVAHKEELKALVDQTNAIILDCPISGTPPMIKAGNGVIMMSGDEQAAERVRPVLEVIAPKTFYVGEYGTGIKLKLTINFIVGANTVSIAEGMLFGAQMGLDMQQMIDIIGPSAAGSAMFNFRAPLIAERKWLPAPGPSKLLWKDLDIIQEQADALGLSAPILRVINQYYKKIEKAGRLDEECAVVYEILEREISKKTTE